MLLGIETYERTPTHTILVCSVPVLVSIRVHYSYSFFGYSYSKVSFSGTRTRRSKCSVLDRKTVWVHEYFDLTKFNMLICAFKFAVCIQHFNIVAMLPPLVISKFCIFEIFLCLMNVWKSDLFVFKQYRYINNRKKSWSQNLEQSCNKSGRTLRARFGPELWETFRSEFGP